MTEPQTQETTTSSNEIRLRVDSNPELQLPAISLYGSSEEALATHLGFNPTSLLIQVLKTQAGLPTYPTLEEIEKLRNNKTDHLTDLSPSDRQNILLNAFCADFLQIELDDSKERVNKPLMPVSVSELNPRTLHKFTEMQIDLGTCGFSHSPRLAALQALCTFKRLNLKDSKKEGENLAKDLSKLSALLPEDQLIEYFALDCAIESVENFPREEMLQKFFSRHEAFSVLETAMLLREFNKAILNGKPELAATLMTKCVKRGSDKLIHPAEAVAALAKANRFAGENNAAFIAIKNFIADNKGIPTDLPLECQIKLWDELILACYTPDSLHYRAVSNSDYQPKELERARVDPNNTVEPLPLPDNKPYFQRFARNNTPPKGSIASFVGDAGSQKIAAWAAFNDIQMHLDTSTGLTLNCTAPQIYNGKVQVEVNWTEGASGEIGRDSHYVKLVHLNSGNVVRYQLSPNINGDYVKESIYNFLKHLRAENLIEANGHLEAIMPPDLRPECMPSFAKVLQMHLGLTSLTTTPDQGVSPVQMLQGLSVASLSRDLVGKKLDPVETAIDSSKYDLVVEMQATGRVELYVNKRNSISVSKLEGSVVECPPDRFKTEVRLILNRYKWELADTKKLINHKNSNAA